ncbi:MAG: alpha/beta hydrolase [Chloroflexi bacterium]|nr:alpha/beta hydrolase [Chloroflexota bacterium]
MNILEHRVVGRGEHSVLFLNGFRMSYQSWDKVYPFVAERSTVLLMNRRGVGASPKAKTPQRGDTVVEDIRGMARWAQVPPPYLLVAHSIGGIYANLYARMFGSEVSGVVFVDASHPIEIVEQNNIKPPRALVALNNGLKAIERLFDRYKYSEDECIHDTVRLIDEAGAFPDIPVTVVTGAKKLPFVPSAAHATHLRYQEELLWLARASRHVMCENSSHFPQITESGKVVGVILDALPQVAANTL